MLGSIVCRYEHFTTDWYSRWAPRLDLLQYGLDPGAPPTRPHRKAWEWCAIASALDERDMLREGRSGCGFAVGNEPLPSAFTASGARVLATDQAPTEDAKDWVTTNQHAANLEACFRPKLIARSMFEQNVRFAHADMNQITIPETERFDFVWSSCSLEHLGSLENGMAFVENTVDLLKPGGIAVHTTEFNTSSNTETVETGPSVLYRRRDIEDIDLRLRTKRAGLARCDFFAGDHIIDLNYDVAPFGRADRNHVKLELGGFVATSFLLIVQKSAPANI